jgi:diguanylate cyclase (GGDEF)-like protein
MTRKLKLILCESFQLECEKIAQKKNWADIELCFLPQICSNPNLVSSAEKQIKEFDHKENTETIVMGCYRGCMDRVLTLKACSYCNLILCNHMIAPPAFIDHLIKQGVYILIPGWLSAWKLHLDQWGLDQQTAKEMFKESIHKLVLLDTSVDVNSKKHLADLGTYLDLAVEVIPVGLDYIELYLSKTVSEWQNKQTVEQIEALVIDRDRTLADYSMAMDMLKNLSKIRDEESVINEIVDLFTMLFSADKVTFLPMVENQLHNRGDHSVNQAELLLLQNWVNVGGESYLISSYGNGFYLKLDHLDQVLGVLSIQALKLPVYRSQYINLSLSIIHLCSLAISNSRLFEQVHILAITDSLTSLFNRRHFYELAEKEYLRSKRYHHPFSMMMLDIDYFKQVNDQYGHIVGDQVLKHIASLCQKNIRQVDLIGRFGGEEFIFLLPETSKENAKKFAERLVKIIFDTPLKLDSKQINVSVSVGVASFEENDLPFEEIIRRSDDALYEAKRKGRNRVELYESVND